LSQDTLIIGGEKVKREAKRVKLLKHVDVEKIDVTRDHYFKDAFVIDLPLDRIPDHVWQNIFENEWRSSRHLWDRKLFVVGKNLRLVTSPDDIKDKLNWAAGVINRTNRGIREYNRGLEVQEMESAKIVEKEKRQAEMIKDTLRRRLGTL